MRSPGVDPYSTLQYSTVRYSTVLYSVIQYCITRHCSVHNSTVLHHTVMFSNDDTDLFCEKETKQIVSVQIQDEGVVVFKMCFLVGFSHHFLVKFLVHICSSFLILLILRHKIVHVRLCLSELHLVHTLPSIPVKESFPPEHSSELLGDPLEYLLNGGGVTHEGGGHGESSGRNVTHCSLHIVRDPLHEVS